MTPMPSAESSIINMGLGCTAGPYDTVNSGTFVIRMLLGLAPLLLITWSGYSTEALPIQNQLPPSNEVLVKIPAEQNMTIKDVGDREQPLNGTVGDKSTLQEKPPCKDFFWKTFSC